MKTGILLPHVARFNEEVSTAEARSLTEQIGSLYDALAFRPVFPPGLAGTDAARAMVEASTGHPFRINNLRDSSDGELFGLLEEAGVSAGR